MLLGFEVEVMVKFTLLFWIITGIVGGTCVALGLIIKAILTVFKSWRAKW